MDLRPVRQTWNAAAQTTSEEFTRQRAKIIAALSAINADVVGLIEIENDAGACGGRPGATA